MSLVSRARRRHASTDNRALEVVLRITALLLWVPYTVAAIHVAYCNSFFIESDSGDITTALAWRNGIQSTLAPGSYNSRVASFSSVPPLPSSLSSFTSNIEQQFRSLSAARNKSESIKELPLTFSGNSTHVRPFKTLSLLPEIHFSHRYNRFYYHFFPEGFDVLALMASMSHVVFVSTIATALTYFCAVHVENGGECVMIISWILGVLSESWWLTSSGEVSSLSQQQQFMKDAEPHAAAVDATFILLYGYPIPTPPWWLWLVASIMTGVLSGVLCKVKDITEGKHDRGTHLFRWFDKSAVQTEDRTLANASLSTTSTSSSSSSSAYSSSRSFNTLQSTMSVQRANGFPSNESDTVDLTTTSSKTHEAKEDEKSGAAPALQSELMQSSNDKGASVPQSVGHAGNAKSTFNDTDAVTHEDRNDDANTVDENDDGHVSTTRLDSTVKKEASHEEGDIAATSAVEDSSKNNNNNDNEHIDANNTSSNHASVFNAPTPHTSLSGSRREPYAHPHNRAHATRSISVPVVVPVHCQTSHKLIGLGERIYTVVPFCTGQWFYFVTRHGWRGIVWGNSIIVLSLGMIGYTMLSYKYLKQQMQSTLDRRYSQSRHSLAQQRGGFAQHRERCSVATPVVGSSPTSRMANGYGNDKTNYCNYSSDDKGSMYSESRTGCRGDCHVPSYPDDSDVGFMDDEGMTIDFIELLSKLFTTSFGVVVLVVLTINIFLTSLAIPFIKALFKLNALVSSVGIIVELIVYDII